MHVDVIALPGVFHNAANVDAILDDGVVLLQVDERNLVADRNVMPAFEPRCRVILRDDAQHVRTSCQVFHDHDADVIFRAMHQKAWYRRLCHSPVLPLSALPDPTGRVQFRLLVQYLYWMRVLYKIHV